MFGFVDLVEPKRLDQLVEREHSLPPERDQLRNEHLGNSVALDDPGNAAPQQQCWVHDDVAVRQTEQSADAGGSQRLQRDHSDVSQAGRVESKMGSAVGDRAYAVCQMLFGSHEGVRRAELAGEPQAVLVEVNSDDRRRPSEFGRHYGAESHAPCTEHDDARPGAYIEGDEHGAGPGLYTATQRSEQFDRQLFVHRDDVARGHHRVGGEGGLTEPAGSHRRTVRIGDDRPLIESGAAEVALREGLAVRGGTRHAFATGPARVIGQHHMIARLQAVDARADDFHDAGTLMAGDDRAHGVRLCPPRQRVGVAQPDAFDADDDLAWSWVGERDVFDPVGGVGAA